MRFRPARLQFYVLTCLLSLVCVFSGFVTPDACAYIYDDFNNGTVIDVAKWEIKNDIPTTAPFSQEDGKLLFAAYKGSGSLVSTQTFKPGFFSMEFYDFTSTNMEPPGSQRGAFAALGLTLGGNSFVRIIRCQNGDLSNNVVYGVFEVNYYDGSEFKVYYVPTTVEDGRLGMYYDGTTVSFFYDDGSGWESTGWIESVTHAPWSGQWTPGWNSDPTLFIRGSDVSGTTRFAADNVTYCPVPEPGTILLLGGGLFGLAALRRRRQA